MALLPHGSALFVCYYCCYQGLLAAVGVSGEKIHRCPGLYGDTVELPETAVNDDACDCADGSDEPGTGACAGQDTTLFFCANEGSTARRLYASRVGDGLCDCCDGSDEAMLAKRFPASACPDTCAEEGAKAREEGEKQAALLRGALQRQEEIRQAGLKDRAQWAADLEQLNHQLTDLQEAFDKAQVAADAQRAAEEEQRKAEEAAKAAANNNSASLCMWRQTAGCDPAGAREPENDKPCTEWIEAGISGYCDCDGDGSQGPEEMGYFCVAHDGEASTGHACETVCAKTGEVETAEGSPTEDAKEEADEKPQVSEYSKWMDGAAETLTAEAEKASEEKPGEEKQVSEYTKWMDGAETAVGTEGTGTDADTPPEDSASVEAEQPAEEDPNTGPTAVEIEEEARSKLNAHKDQISTVQAKLDSLASDEHLGFADLSGRTLSKHISEWDYKIEFFQKAMQDHTSLGDWSKWTGRNTAEFDRGTMCWGGPARKMNVQFECAMEEDIVDVFEPSRCVYQATIKHPGACDHAELDMLTTGKRIISPKDEL